MRISTIALATAFALSGTVALAQDAGGTSVRHTRHHKSHASAHHTTVGMSRMHRRATNSGNPNGTAGGPTSLSGTGSSQFGGSSPGTSGRN
jgi:hypothetical protein